MSRADLKAFFASGLYDATKLFGSLESVWLDVEMNDMSEVAMKEGVCGSKVVLAIITDDGESAYFDRPYCVKELRWAMEAGVFIQPIIAAEDKPRIGDLLARAPADLRDLLSATDFIHLVSRFGT